MYFIIKTVIVFLILNCLVEGNDKLESLEEAINVATSSEFGDIFEGKGGTASQLLSLFQEKTKIKKDYINKIFLESAEVQSLEDLDEIHLDIHKAVDLANAVIKHFQANPMAGRKDEL